MAAREYLPDSKPCRWADEHRCTARKSTKQRCTLPRMKGQGVCFKHGGKAPQNLAAGARRELERTARAALSGLDADPVENPLAELSKLAGQVVAFKDACGQLVDDLEAIRFEDAKGSEQLRSEVAVFTTALAECRQVLTALAKLNIDERLAAISERQADAIVAAVEAALAHAGVTGSAAIEARHVAARHLRAV